MGKVVTDGGRLYHDLWDTKLPSVALLTTLLYAAFGGAWWPYVLTQCLAGLVTAAMLASAARRLAGRSSDDRSHAAAIAAGAYALVLLNMTQFTSTGFQLETLQTLFACGAAWIVVNHVSRGGGQLGGHS